MKASLSEYFQLELRSRRSANQGYSLRAFARDLGISPGFLSHLLKGEKKLSPDKAAELAKKMKLTAKESRFLLNLCRYEAAQNPAHRQLLERDLARESKNLVTFNKLKSDQFQMIADWYHLAILELAEVPGAKPCPTWISQRLGIPVSDATLALERLQRLKMMKINEDGGFRKTRNNSVKDAPSTAVRKFHLQHLKNAQDALEKVAFEKRHFSGITLALDPSNLPEAIEKIHSFRLEMSKLFGKGNKKKVYHLAVQLFPLGPVRGEE